MMIAVEDVLQQAVEAHKAGKLQDAEVLYRAILQAQPTHPDANHNLGVLAVSLNKSELALPFLKKALEVNPQQVQFWISYADALIKTNQVAVAKDVLERGKKLGVVSDSVGALDVQFAHKATATKTGPRLQKQSSSFTQQHKKVSIKKEKKKNSSINQSNTNRLGSPSKLELNGLLEHYQKGEFDSAENLAKTIIHKYPNHSFSWKVLGAVFKQTGRLQDSVIATQKAILISPNDEQAYSNLGLTLQELGRLEDAETSYKKAIAIKPEFAEAYYNLGITLYELGRLEEAEASYKKAIAIKPVYAEAHSNLGNTLKEIGSLEVAAESYKKAISINPEYSDAYYNLAITLQELDSLDEAHIAVTKSIEIKPTHHAKRLFVEITKKIDIGTWNQSLSQFVTNALLEPWSRPSDLIIFACRLLKVDTEFNLILNQTRDFGNLASAEVHVSMSTIKKVFNASPLLQAMLTSCPIPDAEVERLLTLLRHQLLKLAQYGTLKEIATEDIVPLYCSLAKQCFINEYVYFQTTEETNLSHQLRDQLTQEIELGGSVSANLVLAIACYFPLYSVAGAEKLLHHKFSDDVKGVLRQQIQEPFEELNLRSSIRALTYIDNQISLAVQSQYEENPYPRWVRLPQKSNKQHLNFYFSKKFPLSAFKSLSNDNNPEVLIAGCGTGQHPIGTSQIFKGSKILALDLSMSSLCYAKRKTSELDIESVEYAQADLLKLSPFDRTFDVIESSGVLHHLENPFEGWEVLLGLLRPSGLMKLGFYSELARQDIVRVRHLISNSGIGTSSQEIRNFRKKLLEKKDSEDYGFAISSADFFSTSACRDLLFHVQEHRMDLKKLSDFLEDHNLNFLGFEIDSSVIRAYKNRFPNDTAANNLDHWKIYEEENPRTFDAMYQFWIQKS